MELMQSHTRSTSFCSLAGNADPKQSETRKNLKHVRICMSPPRSGSRCIKRHRPPVENGDRHQAESFNDGLMHKCEKHIMQMPAEKNNGQCSRKHNSPQKKGRGGWDKIFLPAEQASEGSCEPACCNAPEML